MKHLLAMTLIVSASLAACLGCKSQWNAPQPPVHELEALRSGGVQMLPKAVIYRTNGDWRDRVPVTVNPQTGQLVSFPAPSDIAGAQMPIPLADGWLLDTRGVNLDTRFTRYTYAQYAALPQTPSTAQLIDSIIPEARITAIERLPMTLSEARADTARVNVIIAGGFPDQNLKVKVK